jgi:hypothetical protein
MKTTVGVSVVVFASYVLAACGATRKQSASQTKLVHFRHDVPPLTPTNGSKVCVIDWNQDGGTVYGRRERTAPIVRVYSIKGSCVVLSSPTGEPSTIKDDFVDKGRGWEADASVGNVDNAKRPPNGAIANSSKIKLAAR